MTDSRAAVGLDRLPWLADEPERPRPAFNRELAGWAVAGALFLAGASYWLGQRSASEPAAPVATQAVPQSSTIPLPEPQAAQPQVQPDVMTDVEPAPAPTVSVPRPAVQRKAPRRRVSAAPSKELAPTASEKTSEAPAATAAQKAPAKEQPLKLWPARVSAGAKGRVVQIGAFGTRQQAKLGWRRMTRAYPAVGRLPATVVSARNSRGRHFYRFQIGTTSQAHSEVLCQRMERIRFSCAVVGLPGEKKAVER